MLCYISFCVVHAERAWWAACLCGDVFNLSLDMLVYLVACAEEVYVAVSAFCIYECEEIFAAMFECGCHCTTCVQA